MAKGGNRDLNTAIMQSCEIQVCYRGHAHKEKWKASKDEESKHHCVQHTPIIAIKQIIPQKDKFFFL